MKADEICRLYNEAKDKGKQIKILAQLNGCSEYDLMRLLAYMGCEMDVPRKSTRWTPEREEKLLQLHAIGKKWREIGEELGMSSSAVQTKFERLTN